MSDTRRALDALSAAEAEDRRTCNILQAAAYAGVSRRTVERWIAAGRVAYEVWPGGRRRVILASLRPVVGGGPPVDRSIGPTAATYYRRVD